MKKMYRLLCMQLLLCAGSVTAVAQKIQMNQTGTRVNAGTNAAITANSLKTLDAGIYYIRVNATGKYLGVEGIIKDNGARLIEWDFMDLDNHKFEIKRQADGYYLIKAMHSNRYLNVASQSVADGAVVLQWDYVEQDNMKWTFIYSSNLNGWIIKNKQSGKEIKLAGALNNAANGTLVLQSNAQPGGQAFTFQPAVNPTVRNNNGPATGNPVNNNAPLIQKSNSVQSVITGSYKVPISAGGNRMNIVMRNDRKVAYVKVKGSEPYMISNSRSKPPITENSETTDSIGRKSIITCITEFKRLSYETIDADIVSLNVSDNIFPGMVFDLQDIQSIGNFNEIVKPKNPITLVANAPTLPNPVQVVNDPNYTNLKQATSTLLNQRANAGPNVIEYATWKEVFDESDFRLNLGLSFGSPFVSFNTAFGYNKKSSTRKFMFDYKMQAYTLEARRSDNGMFVNPADNNVSSQVYVDKLTMGARIIVTFEASANSESFNTKLNIEGRYALVTAGVDMFMEQLSRSQNTQFKIFVMGLGAGQAGTAIDCIGVTDLKQKLAQIIGSLKQMSPYASSWGRPIGYSLRFLDGNVAIASAGIDELPQRNCTVSELPLETFSVSLANTLNTGDDCDPFGNIFVLAFDRNHKLIGPINNDINLLSIRENSHLTANNSYVSTTGGNLFNKAVSFKIPKAQQEGAYIKIYYNMVDYDGGSGNDVIRPINSSNEPLPIPYATNVTNVTPLGDFYYVRKVMLNNETINLCLEAKKGQVSKTFHDFLTDNGDSRMDIYFKVCLTQ